MTTLVKLIIKVIDGSNISVILDDKLLPTQWISNLEPCVEDTIKCIAERFNIHEAYINPKLTYFGTDDGDPTVYYTIHCPKEFLDEKAALKLRNNFEHLSEQDRISIRQSFSILPY